MREKALAFLVAQITPEQTGLYTTGQAAGLGNAPIPLPVLLAGIINAILGLVGLVLIVFLVWGGVLWTTSKGEKAKIETARDMIKNAIIGIIIIVAAYAITTTVISLLGGALIE